MWWHLAGKSLEYVLRKIIRTERKKSAVSIFQEWMNPNLDILILLSQGVRLANPHDWNSLKFTIMFFFSYNITHLLAKYSFNFTPKTSWFRREPCLQNIGTADSGWMTELSDACAQTLWHTSETLRQSPAGLAKLPATYYPDTTKTFQRRQNLTKLWIICSIHNVGPQKPVPVLITNSWRLAPSSWCWRTEAPYLDQQRRRELAEIRQIGIILWKIITGTEFLQTCPIRR